MVYRGLISFGVGGALLLLALLDIFESTATGVTYYNLYQMLLQSAVLGFVSFLLMGLGLYLIVKEANQTKQATPSSTP